MWDVNAQKIKLVAIHVPLETAAWIENDNIDM